MRRASCLRDGSSPPVSPHVKARRRMALYGARALLLLAVFLLWWALTELKILPTFFFGRPLFVLRRVGAWFVSGKIYPHLAVTLAETALAFALGTAIGVVVGLWLG